MTSVLAAIGPVFVVTAAGYLLRRYVVLDVKTLSALNIYLFIPALVFASLSQQTIAWALFGKYAAGVILMLLATGVVLELLARFRGMGQARHSAFLMTMFPNLGNFGLPVCKFAFGETGLTLAVVVMVCGSFLQNSVGIYFAQRSRHGIRQALLKVLGFPMIYAFAAALLSQQMSWRLPEFLFRGVEITSEAAIPVQLMILGIQLAETRLQKDVDIFLACFVRLVLGPIFAAVIATLAGMEGLSAGVFILQMSGPVAVGMAVYGIHFEVSPGFLANVVAWTFLLSLLSVSLVLYFLLRPV
ncbi:MAG: AEC family transporter [Candidatus Hydrogenedentes bacterium]|nr:AEC family transporter [Candidatus Hydrogenedentota bacterium]